MASFTGYFSNNSNYYITLTLTEKNISNINNTSDLDWILTATKSTSNQGRWDYDGRPVVVSINNNQVFNEWLPYDFSSYGSKTITLASGTILNIKHDDDGFKNVPVYASVDWSDNALGIATINENMPLTKIARASQPTVSSSSVILGNSVTIDTNRAVSSFTHTITYNFGNESGIIASNVGTSTTWTPSIDLANQIPNATSGSCNITVSTYNGETLIGSRSVLLTLNVPTTIVPSVNSINISEGNTSVVPSSWGLYVQNKSKLKVVINASGSYGSTIKSYKVTGIDNNVYNSNDFVSNILTQSGSRTITVTVTDSRGRTTSLTETYSCVAYSNPIITSAMAQRCLQDGTLDDDGTYLRYTFKASISPIENKNSHLFQIGYKTSIESSYNYVTVDNSNYSIDKENVVLENVIFSSDVMHDIQFLATDYFTNSSNVAQLETGFDLINFNSSGKSMAIGKVSDASENEEILEIALNTKFTKDVISDVTIKGNLDANNIKNEITGAYYLNGRVDNLISNSNFDNCVTQGEYRVSGTNITNSPYEEGCYGKLIVTHSEGTTAGNSWIWQHFIDTKGREYKRYKIRTANWTSWTQINVSDINSSNNNYIKFNDGTLICIGNVSFNGISYGGGSKKTISLSQNFVNNSYKVVLTNTSIGNYWSWIVSSVINKKTNQFDIQVWNNASDGTSDDFSHDWIAIGRWK